MKITKFRHFNLNQAVKDYGLFDASTDASPRTKAGDQTMTPRMYVRAVHAIRGSRKMRGVSSLVATAGHLVQIPLGSWANRRGAAASWIAYTRCLRVSMYRCQDRVTTAAMLWRLHISAAFVNRYLEYRLNLAFTLVGCVYRAFKVSRDKSLVRDLCRILRSCSKSTALLSITNIYDIRRIARLPPRLIRNNLVVLQNNQYVQGICTNKGLVDWRATERNIRRFERLPMGLLRSANFPVRHFFDSGFDLFSGDNIREPVLSFVGLLAVVRENGLPPAWTRHVADTTYGHKGLKPIVGDWVLRIIHKRGWDKKIAGIKDIGLSVFEALVLAAHKDIEIPESAWDNAHTLLEAIHDAGIHEVGGECDIAVLRARSKAHRCLDRLAQRNPKWAIDGWHFEYRRGTRIAHILSAALEHVTPLVKNNMVVFHGRDCELLYQLALRAGLKRRNMRYVITSRSMTTHGTHSADFMAYLNRLIPANAHHVDTGFAGSIPVWIDEHVASIAKVHLISADDPRDQMKMPIANDEVRDIVLADIEHSAQRFEHPRRWGEIVYAVHAPAFWAKLYGVCDALGIPRRIP